MPPNRGMSKMDWSMSSIWIVILGVVVVLGSVESSVSGWKKTPTQYHIQTDEGEERFFKFQTYNGQYRKERRLDDGTVIGSYGWVDPTGYLRMTDYIADSKGYRVVKELKEFVGMNSIMDDTPPRKYSQSPKKHSVKVAKQPDVFFANIKDNPTPDPYLQFNTVSVTPIPLRPPASAFIATSPKNSLYYPEPGKSGAPHKVFVTSGGVRPAKPVPLNSIYYYPEESRTNVTFTTPSPLVPIASLVGNSRFPGRRPPVQIYRQTNSEAAEGFEAGSGDVSQSYATPLRSRDTGFIYKIPNQYHKEETDQRDGSRQGSFGYVDPFGIRRVIHYRAGADGFQHQKDFKYVGRQY